MKRCPRCGGKAHGLVEPCSVVPTLPFVWYGGLMSAPVCPRCGAFLDALSRFARWLHGEEHRCH